jgi:hypothetical protein
MRIVVCSIPKSGTYLVGEILRVLGLRNSGLHLGVTAMNDYGRADVDTARRDPNRFLVTEPLTESLRRLGHGEYALSHLPPSTAYALRECELVFVYRNLRDVLVSFCRWIGRTGRWQAGRTEPWRHLPDGPDKLLGFLDAHHQVFSRTISNNIRWREMMLVPQFSFEQLMGDEGADRVVEALRTLASVACRHELTDGDLVHALQSAKGADTMTRSETRSNRDAFWDDRVEAAFWELGFGALNHQLGFESQAHPSSNAPKAHARRGLPRFLAALLRAA